MDTNKCIAALMIATVCLLPGCSLTGSSAKDRCLANNKPGESKYYWVPESGTLNAYLTPDDAGQCVTKVGIQG